METERITLIQREQDRLRVLHAYAGYLAGISGQAITTVRSSGAPALSPACSIDSVSVAMLPIER